MATQDIIIFEPTSIEETDALIAFGKALKLKFKIAESEDFNENKEIQIPEAHKAIVAERLEDYRKNPNTNFNFDELLKDIRKKYNL
ncbi:hypothetical protein [Kaistella jeonii]|uniref:Uncharacterized protein n=1 Tax=Kaistella jeonii TaxID=266749 RepID=A0A0C1FB51_9FLAO|nr:hypothetical protein [Kaistella jeonii]KIA90362.1 hypothetical protein OA86_00180 [Kaistella jeonii]SFB73962.1 hypothetical protein SAMN05421876_101503 [Kaistella jeonii]VEI95089.1 Uncharacterised protein [Kaistella jeonii]